MILGRTRLLLTAVSMSDAVGDRAVESLDVQRPPIRLRSWSRISCSCRRR